MAKQNNITTNVVVQIDDDILKQLLEKISDIQGQIDELTFKQNSLDRKFQLSNVHTPGYDKQ